MRKLWAATLLLGSSQLFAAPVLVLGDSLAAGYGIDPAQGWVSLLQQRLDQQGYELQVINASISGETTGGGLSRLPALLAQYEPRLVMLELGANDGLRGTPLPVIRDTLTQLVQASRNAGAEVLLIGNRLPSNYGVRYTDGFFALFAEVAQAHRVALVPFLLDGVALDWDLMQSDGLHPNEQAQMRLLETVWKDLQPLLPTPALAPDAAGS